MTLPARVDWSSPNLQALAHLRMRISGQRYRDFNTPELRVKSGMYAIGFAKDRKPHAVRIVPVIKEVNVILNALTHYGQASEAQARIADIWRQIALCGIEAHLDGGLEAARPWIPTKDGCPACKKAC